MLTTSNRLGDRRKPDPAQTGERWQYNADNQLIESATENSALLGRNSLPVTHDYDASGSLIRKRTPAGTEASHPYDNQRFVYDAQNRLTEVQDPAGHPIASYQYDPQGRRIRKTVHRAWNGSGWESLAEARTATYVYGEEGLVAEYQAQGNNAAQLIAQYGWQPQGEWGTDPVWIKTMPAGGSQASYFYYQNDHLGTPQKIIDGQGQSVWGQKATAFGETTVDAASALVNNLRFPGQYFDTETDLHYNGFRDYDPRIGRYSESDPIGLDGGINQYAYVGNNPLIYFDPLGLARGGCFGAGCHGGGLLDWYNPDPYKSEPISPPGTSATTDSANPNCPLEDPCDKKLSDNLLRERGIDPHAIKREMLGSRGGWGAYNLCGCKDGRIILKRSADCKDPGGEFTGEYWK